MFIQMKKEFQKNLEKIIKDQEYLFIVDIDPDKLWELYLENIPEEFNKIFRERREHDCSGCRYFIKHFGNVIAIKNGKKVSIWDFETTQKEYQESFNKMAEYIYSKPIKNVFLTNQQNQGHDKDYENLDDAEIITWEHFYFQLPKRFASYKTKADINKLHGQYRDTRNVFHRSLQEISTEATDTVLELIEQKSLYKGEEWKRVLQTFRSYQEEFAKINDPETWLWQTSVKAGISIGRIRNHSIGTLLQDLSNNIDLDTAIHRYEKVVAPTNYKRPKAIFTKKMVQQAQEKVVSLGFENSLGRRHARTEDITVNNILFANKDSIKRMKNNLDVFDDLTDSLKDKLPKSDKIEEINYETFINDVLPKLVEVELFMENRLEPNLTSLIAPTDPDAPTMFKWNNAFSWAYNGNITDSMKQRVQKAGGNVNGVLRFSIMWNENGDNNNDFDAHAVEPDGNHIYYPLKGVINPSSGMLDVDIINPFSRQQVPDGGAAVENIIWTNKRKMPHGTYYFYVHNFSHDGGRSGFSAEVEFDGIIHHFSYDKELKHDEKVIVAKVTFDGKNFKINPKLPDTITNKTIWNIRTQKFIPVSTIMYSPNYWDNQHGIGHRHLFFMLNNCLNDSQPNGFFNEFLSENLLEHKKVFEALGSRMKVDYSDNQLSGVGFSTTKRNYVVLRVKGTFNRIIKITF